MEFRHPYDDKINEAVAEDSYISFKGDPGKTLQEPAEDADLNVIMRRFGVTDGSILPRFDNPNLLYGDFSEFPTDPIERQNAMRYAELEFAKYPADVRARFGTPGEMFAFMANRENFDESIRIGLLDKKATPPKSALDTIAEKLDTLVSPSTGSVKESPVQNTEGSK